MTLDKDKINMYASVLNCTITNIPFKYLGMSGGKP